jgi:hypothetical protein
LDPEDESSTFLRNDGGASTGLQGIKSQRIAAFIVTLEKISNSIYFGWSFNDFFQIVVCIVQLDERRKMNWKGF